ncbi:hypothetical protein [Ensifer aridi]|nr:hypothetical protein [Ensifer aridi]
MNWAVFIACVAVVAWMAALTLVVRGFAEHEFRSNGFKAKVKR